MARELARKLRKGLRNAFDLQGPYGPLSEEDRRLLTRIAKAVVARRMAAPATLFLNSMTPLNSVGSQAMVFLRPLLAGLFDMKDYDRAEAIMERREGLGALAEEIERLEEERGKEAKK